MYLKALGKLRVSCACDQHDRDRRAVHDLFGNAAVNPAVKALAIVGRHYDQVGIDQFGLVNDPFGRASRPVELACRRAPLSASIPSLYGQDSLRRL